MELLQPLLAIALVFGLLLGARWALRRRGLLVPAGLGRARKGSARLEVIERVALAPQHSLQLVRVADRALVIELHAGGCTLLESLPLEAVERARGIDTP